MQTMEAGSTVAPAPATPGDPLEIQAWYPRLAKHSIKTKCIPLPRRFCSYLVEDGIILPEKIGKQAPGKDMLSDDEDDDGGGRKEAVPIATEPDPFHDLDEELERVMVEFGGKIFIKVNDKAPVDAVWINCGTLMCNSLASVYMLLKASEQVAHSLKESENYLVVRKWANLFPSMEFRCFIRNETLTGICQKEISTHFSFLVSDRERLRNIILQFFYDNVKHNLPVPSVVLDLYVDKQDRVWIIGFSPYGADTETDPLLFSWEEIDAFASSTSHIAADDWMGHFSEFRVVEDERRVRSHAASIAASRGPSDFSLISGDIFNRKCDLLQHNGSSSDEEDGP